MNMDEPSRTTRLWNKNKLGHSPNYIGARVMFQLEYNTQHRFSFPFFSFLFFFFKIFLLNSLSLLASTGAAGVAIYYSDGDNSGVTEL